jgi:hypothetical protein
MGFFILPIVLVAWLEASWTSWLEIAGAHIPLTLLVILWLLYRGWIGGWQALALAGIGGYVLDLLASARSGFILVAMVLAAGSCAWLLGRSHSRWQRWGAIVVGLLVYELVGLASLGWQDFADTMWQITLFTSLSLVVFGLMRWMGKRVEAWL